LPAVSAALSGWRALIVLVQPSPSATASAARRKARLRNNLPAAAVIREARLMLIGVMLNLCSNLPDSDLTRKPAKEVR